MEIYSEHFVLLYISWFRITDIMDSESIMTKNVNINFQVAGCIRFFVYWAHQSNFCPLHHYLESCNKFTYMSLQIYIANIFACRSKFCSSSKKVIKTFSFPYIPVIIIRIIENLWKHCTYLHLNIGLFFDFCSVKRMNEHLLVI